MQKIDEALTRARSGASAILALREPRDADLILGQGMVNSGWHAHQLTQPGDYLLTDAQRDHHVTEGIAVAALEAICGMGSSWVYRRLHAHATAGRAVQVRRG